VVVGLSLLEHSRKNVSTTFAYWVGVGDAIAGLLACGLLVQLWKTGQMSRRVASWTILFGMAGFAWSYGTAVLSFETSVQVFAKGEVHATDLLPPALIPFLLAPIAMAYMVMTLIELNQDTPNVYRLSAGH